jgi:hypothetical protein
MYRKKKYNGSKMKEEAEREGALKIQIEKTIGKQVYYGQWKSRF